MAAAAEKEKAAGAAYLARAAADKGRDEYRQRPRHQYPDSWYRRESDGPGPGQGALRRQTGGRPVFDSSIERKEPATFPLTGVIPCWTEAVQLMKVGGKSQIVCPSALAYGDAGRPPQIPGGATLVFQVELLDIVKTGGAGPAAPTR